VLINVLANSLSEDEAELLPSNHIIGRILFWAKKSPKFPYCLCKEENKYIKNDDLVIRSIE
jgi:hypothetical protein